MSQGDTELSGTLGSPAITKSTKIRMSGVDQDDVKLDVEKEDIEAAWDALDCNLGDLRVLLNLSVTGTTTMSASHSSKSVFLKCKICEAKFLKAMDSNGFSDPYVVAYIVDDDDNSIEQLGTFKTNTVYKTLNPVWNHDIELGKESNLRVDDYTLVFEVWDSDKWSADDLMGKIKVPLWNIPHRWDHEVRASKPRRSSHVTSPPLFLIPSINFPFDSLRSS